MCEIFIKLKESILRCHYLHVMNVYQSFQSMDKFQGMVDMYAYILHQICAINYTLLDYYNVLVDPESRAETINYHQCSVGIFLAFVKNKLTEQSHWNGWNVFSRDSGVGSRTHCNACQFVTIQTSFMALIAFKNLVKPSL